MKNSEINYFIKNGFFKIKLQRSNFLYLKNRIKNILKKQFNFKKVNLEKLHKKIKIEELNDLRLKVFKKINDDNKFKKNTYQSAKNLFMKQLETSYAVAI